jgi:hypothetical protein
VTECNSNPLQLICVGVRGQMKKERKKERKEGRKKEGSLLLSEAVQR